MSTSQIPSAVAAQLADPRYVRPSSASVDTQLAALGADQHPLLRAFFEKYEGPFWSEYLGFELLDILEGTETVSSVTEICRRQFGFRQNYVVLSELSAGQVAVLDVLADKVFEVDFEGGEQALMLGQLAPRWQSFEQFLLTYFTGTV